MDTRTAHSAHPHVLVTLFLASREERNCEPRTLADYAYTLNLFFETPGVPADPKRLSGDHVTLFLAHLRKRGTGPGGRESYRRRVAVFLNWLYHRDAIKRDPRKGVDRVQLVRYPLPQMTEASLKRLLTVAVDRPRTSRGNRISAENQLRNVAILRLMWATGMRRSEICALLYEDVSWDVLDGDGHRVGGGELLVRHAKGKKFRRQPFDRQAKTALLEYIAEKRGEAAGPLFLSRSGAALTPNGLTLTLLGLERRAGVEAPSHSFRRGFARRMRAGGLDLGEVAALMGHATTDMTRHYSQDGETDAAIEAYRRLAG